MTITQIDQQRNSKGVFSISNESSGWYAVSRDRIHMITYCQGKFTFAVNDDVNMFYTEKGFARKITELLNGGF